MGLRLLCLLLCAAALTALGKDDGGDERRWSRQRLPVLLDAHTEPLNAPSFTGREEDEEEEGGGKKEAICGIECQSRLPLIGQREQERILGYETMYENGTRTHTDVTLQGFNATGVAARSSSRGRRKRQVYGADGRFVITDSQYITNYPFSTAVRLSTGCSGVLVSPKHVLTAAHCIHDGSRYLDGAKRLRVGALQLKAKRGRGGGGGGGGRRGKGGRKRSSRRREGEERAEEGEEHNSIDGELERARQGGRREAGERGRGKQRRGGARRARRSAEPGKAPVFRWTRVKQTRIPQGWIRPEGSPDPVAPDYDYALLELKRPMKQKHMEVGVAPTNSAPLARIHFSGYDSDKSLLDGRGDGKVVYRFCSVAKESDDLMYQHCDAQSGATGAGVYVRMRQDAGGKGRWQRRVIGVFSGHQWVETEDGQQRDFNVAVRITPTKYAQICHWIHGDPALCKEI